MPGRTLAGATKEGFTSKEQDAETGLDYFGARYYMPALGRWTSVDPPGGEFPDWSPYNYVKNDPVSRSDPSGLCPACAVAGAVVFGGIRLGYNLLNERPWDEHLAEDIVVGGAIGFTLGAAAPALLAGGGLLAAGAARTASAASAGIKLVEPQGRKLSQMIARWGGTGGRDTFMKHANSLATESRDLGQAVSGTVQGVQVTIYRLGQTYMKVDATGKILSYVPDRIAQPGWGIVQAYSTLGGK
jgi:RHS repeat-associated protein